MTKATGAQQSIVERIQAVRDRIARACDDAGRDRDSVRLMLAIKTQSNEAVREAIAAGATLLGHNRVQELTATREDLAAHDLSVDLRLIGPLQSNKVNHALRSASGIDTVDSERLARKLSTSFARLREAGEQLPAGDQLPVMVQVNTSGESSKSGVHPEEALELLATITELPHLQLTGLMTIGAMSDDDAVVRRSFAQLRHLHDQAADQLDLPDLVELSMGMSNDLELAIQEGATIVRIGRGIFGERTAQ